MQRMNPSPWPAMTRGPMNFPRRHFSSPLRRPRGVDGGIVGIGQCVGLRDEGGGKPASRVLHLPALGRLRVLRVGAALPGSRSPSASDVVGVGRSIEFALPVVDHEGSRLPCECRPGDPAAPRPKSSVRTPERRTDPVCVGSPDRLDPGLPASLDVRPPDPVDRQSAEGSALPPHVSPPHLKPHPRRDVSGFALGSRRRQGSMARAHSTPRVRTSRRHDFKLPPGDASAWASAQVERGECESCLGKIIRARPNRPCTNRPHRPSSR